MKGLFTAFSAASPLTGASRPRPKPAPPCAWLLAKRSTPRAHARPHRRPPGCTGHPQGATHPPPATRKGWPYYTRHGASGTYIVGPPLAGGRGRVAGADPLDGPLPVACGRAGAGSAGAGVEATSGGWPGERDGVVWQQKEYSHMRIGVGLPNGVPGTSGQLLIEWAKRADEGPFSSLGVVDRLAYDSYDPLSALAVAAAVTSRVRLATTIVISLLRPTGTLAKAAASLDALSGGRLVLGLAVGARREDFEAAGVDYHERGKRLTEQLIALRTLWEEGALSPRTEYPSGPPLLVGGLSDAGFARMARYADGYVHGGGPPRAFARAADKARAAWRDFRRPGQPQIWAQGYFAFGDT